MYLPSLVKIAKKNPRYSWIDVNARKQCTKCWQSMTDGFTFLDTEFGQKMQRQMKVFPKLDTVGRGG